MRCALVTGVQTCALPIWRWRNCRRRSSVSPPLDRNAAVDHEERLFQVSDLKAFLQGEWSLERRVQDRRAAQDGRLSGAAAFTADGSGLLCQIGRAHV